MAMKRLISASSSPEEGYLMIEKLEETHILLYSFEKYTN